MPVYVDVLLIVNAFVNRLMLAVSMKYLRFDAGRVRLLLASVLGSIFSLRIFLPDTPLPLEFFIRAAMCAAIVLTAFGFHSLKAFIRSVCVFLTVSFIFGGIMSAILFFFDTGVMLYRNGSVYFDIDLKILAVTSVVSFAAVNAVSRIISKKAADEKICLVNVFYGGKRASGRGFFDTGNGLREMFSGFPVIVAQHDTVKNIIPDEITAYLDGGDVEAVSAEIRLIPVSGVGGSGILPAFRPERTEIKSMKHEKTYRNVYIAVSRQSFFGGEFEFIINNEINGDDTYELNEKTENPACKA